MEINRRSAQVPLVFSSPAKRAQNRAAAAAPRIAVAMGLQTPLLLVLSCSELPKLGSGSVHSSSTLSSSSSSSSSSASASAKTAVDVVAALAQAADLLDRQLLTVAEFSALKAELLQQSPAPPPPEPSLPKFFGGALASHTLPAGTELTVFEHSVLGDKGAALTLFQYLGQSATGFNDTRIRMYIDGERSASLDYSLYMGVGLGFNGSSLVNRSWGTARIGSLAAYSTYSTVRVPFSRSIRITVEMPAYINTSQLIWVDVRGAEGMPIAVGDSISFSPNDYRLRLYKNEAVHVPPGYMIPLAKTNRSGLLYMTAVQVESLGYGYLEGCWRVRLGQGDWTLLTSGGEEMFLGAYYFDAHDTSILPFVGLTRKEMTPMHGRMKATMSAFVECAHLSPSWPVDLKR